MSSKIRMVGYMTLLLKIVALLFSATLVLSDQTVDSLKSFKLSENIIYDCIDIYKQPSLNHPLLKNHKIQMKPSVSFSGSEIKNQTTSNVSFSGSEIKNQTTSNKKIACPKGSVPILRNTKKNVSNAQHFEEMMHFNPLQAGSKLYRSGVELTVNGPYRGVQALSTVYEMSIANGEASYAAIFVESAANYIQVGWMINPGAFGDQRVWSYGSWKGKDGKGCYNVDCPGFVQVSTIEPINSPNNHDLNARFYHFFIYQDPGTGNWWAIRLRKDRPNTSIGYWPKELFDNMSDGAQIAGAAGFARASPYGLNPPMGNGNLPSENEDYDASAIFTNVEVTDHNYHQQIVEDTYLTLLQDGPKCYGLQYGNFKQRPDLGFFFNYGGPGGTSC